MSVLDGIGVSIESAKAPADWGNALPVLHEILSGLIRLQQHDEASIIDLSALPFGPGARDQLLAALGEGEVSARIDALGPTHIQETALAGVWRVHYHDPEDREIALHIEITRTPRLLATPADDIALAIEQLRHQLDSSSPASGGSEE